MKILFVAATLLTLNTLALAQSAIPTLPKDMLGIWGADKDACADEDSDGRLTIEASPRSHRCSSSARSSGSRTAP